jgi:hypothetical protein
VTQNQPLTDISLPLRPLFPFLSQEFQKDDNLFRKLLQLDLYNIATCSPSSHPLSIRITSVKVSPELDESSLRSSTVFGSPQLQLTEFVLFFLMFFILNIFHALSFVIEGHFRKLKPLVLNIIET